jgi:hypothetical protein
MAGLYPEIEPYDHGVLDVGDGNCVYWEPEYRMAFARLVTHYWRHGS